MADDQTERTDTGAFKDEARERLEQGRAQQAEDLEQGEQAEPEPEPQPEPRPDPDGPDTPAPA